MGGGGGLGSHFSYQEVSLTTLPYIKMSCLFLSLSFEHYGAQTLSQIQSQEATGHKKQHIMITDPLTYVTNGIQDAVKYCIKSSVHLDLCPNNMLFLWITTFIYIMIHLTYFY